MDFDEVVAKRRSIRKFKEDSVSEGLLENVLEAGRWAPSAGNSQPWHFIVVTDADMKRRVAEACTQSSKKAWSRFPPHRAKYLAQRGGSWDKSAMARIPTLVVVCYEFPEGIREELILGSIWAAIENMLLAATAKGLGSCIYTFYDLDEEEKFKQIFHVPDEYRMAAMIQLGYSKTEPPLSTRRTLEEIVSYEHF